MRGVREYTIRRYGYKAWEIRQKFISKDGAVQWRPIKYPGNLIAAAHGLIDLHLPEDMPDTTPANLRDLIQAMERSTETVIGMLREVDADG